jgi:hypothetical protein
MGWYRAEWDHGSRRQYGTCECHRIERIADSFRDAGLQRIGQCNPVDKWDRVQLRDWLCAACFPSLYGCAEHREFCDERHYIDGQRNQQYHAWGRA